MKFFSRKKSNRVFHLQQDGRFGSAGWNVQDSDIEQFVATGDGTKGGGRGPLPLGISIRHLRIRIGFIVIFAVAFLFIGRSAQLQVIQGSHYADLSSGNRERIEMIVPARGLIYDVNGETIAWNEPAFVLTMTQSDLPDGDERVELFEYVSSRVGLQPTDFDLLLSQYSSRLFEPIPVVDDLTYETAISLAIETPQLPGFELSTRTKRVYSSSAPSLSHVLGYTGLLSSDEYTELKDQSYRLIDTVGKTGIELERESFLRGVPGKLIYEVDALGNKLSILAKEDPVLGSNITLSIDAEFQKYIEQQMEDVFNRVSASRGTVIALNPQTGAIHALVSLPTYDANEFSDGISVDRYAALVEDEDQPLFFRGISGEFPSGSTFKPFVVYAALAEGIVGEHTSFLSTGGLRIGQWYFPDWKAGGHGITDARKAIAESVNTYFYIIGGGFDNVTGLGVDRITQYAEYFGFGSVTGIDLPQEADGFLPSKDWKEEVKEERWYVGDTYHLSIGQGDFLTTPLQMAVATAAIANGGKMLEPYVVESADGFAQEQLIHSDLSNVQDLDSDALTIVRQGMRQTVTTGSALSLSVLSEPVAGKTGTAQTPGDKPYHAWFTGFAPYEDPDIALVVLVEEGGESNDAAVPLAKNILNWWFINR